MAADLFNCALKWLSGLMAGVVILFGINRIHREIWASAIGSPRPDAYLEASLFMIPVLFLVILSGCWVGGAVNSRSLGAGLSERNRYELISWTMGSGISLVQITVLGLAFSGSSSVTAQNGRMFLEILSVAGVGWAIYQWFKGRMAAISERDRGPDSGPQ